MAIDERFIRVQRIYLRKFWICDVTLMCLTTRAELAAAQVGPWERDLTHLHLTHQVLQGQSESCSGKGTNPPNTESGSCSPGKVTQRKKSTSRPVDWWIQAFVFQSAASWWACGRPPTVPSSAGPVLGRAVPGAQSSRGPLRAPAVL